MLPPLRGTLELVGSGQLEPSRLTPGDHAGTIVDPGHPGRARQVWEQLTEVRHFDRTRRHRTHAGRATCGGPAGRGTTHDKSLYGPPRAGTGMWGRTGTGYRRTEPTSG